MFVVCEIKVQSVPVSEACFVYQKLFKTFIVRKIMNTDLYCLIFVCKERELSTYISLVLKIDIIGKIVGIRLILCWNSKCIKSEIQFSYILFYWSISRYHIILNWYVIHKNWASMLKVIGRNWLTKLWI